MKGLLMNLTRHFRFPIFILLIISSLLTVPVIAYGASGLSTLFRESAGKIKELGGLEVRKDIKIIIRPREKMAAEVYRLFLSSLGNGVNSSDKITANEYFLKRLTLVDEDFSLEEVFVSSAAEQVNGYYLPEKKELVVVKTKDTDTLHKVVLHELFHASQDNYFDLYRLRSARVGNSDALLAYSALIEGQAMAFEILALAGERMGSDTAGQIFKTTLLDFAKTLDQTTIENFVTDTAKFPYTHGFVFVSRLYTFSNKWDFRPMFDRIPETTEQILHHKKYRSNEGPMTTVLQKTEGRFFSIGPTSPKFLYSTRMGEYYIRSIFNATLPTGLKKNIQAAMGWGGDYLAIFDAGPDGGGKFFIWDTLWDTEADAKEFFFRYARMTQKRYDAKQFYRSKSFDLIYPRETPDIFIKHIGNRVLIIEGAGAPGVLERVKEVLGTS